MNITKTIKKDEGKSMKKKAWAGCLVVAMVAMMFGGCGKTADEQASGAISDDAVVRAYDTIDFDTVTILDEETPLGSSVNNADAAEMAALRNLAQGAFDLVNQQRAQAGLPALAWDNDLELAAAVRAAECAQSFSHTRPDGSDWYTVNAQIMHGENLAYGYNTANEVVTAWMNSPTHRDNIMYPEFTKCSIAIYKVGGVYYFAQEFRY